MEVSKSHVQISGSGAARPASSSKAGPGRRPISGSYSSHDMLAAAGRSPAQHEAVNRRSSYASNREKLGSKGSLHTSNSSLHTDSLSPSPSPTTLVRPALPAPRAQQSRHSPAPGLQKRWSSTQDFRELAPSPAQLSLARRPGGPTGSLASLRSPFGSQQNLAGAVAGGGAGITRAGGVGARHGTREAAWAPEEGLIRLPLRGRNVSLVCPAQQLDSYRYYCFCLVMLT